ncbi:MAG: hypothetical protein AB1942_12545 [Pseudomonadota bacterium]
MDQINRAAVAATIDLADRCGDHDYKIRGLWQLATLNMDGELHSAFENARRLRNAAAGRDAAAERLVGERMMGSVLHLLGRHSEARLLLETTRAAYDQPERRASALRFQYDQLVLTLDFLAWIEWLQGGSDRSKSIAEAAVAEAMRVDHAGSLGFALDVAVTLAILRGDLADARGGCARLTDMGANVGFDVWMARSKVLNAIIQVRSGDLGGGLPSLQSALARPVWKLTTYRTPLFLGELAQAEMAAGLSDKALATIEEALGWFKGADDFWYAPECLRVKAQLLILQSGKAGVGEADVLLSHAARVATDHGAITWQRRIAADRKMLCGAA